MHALSIFTSFGSPQPVAESDSPNRNDRIEDAESQLQSPPPVTVSAEGVGLTSSYVWDSAQALPFTVAFASVL